MQENDEGRMDYVRRRFCEAETLDDIERIRQELITDESIPRGTVDRVKNDLKKSGDLPQSNAGYRVEIQQYPNGKLELSYQGRVIKAQEAPPKPGFFRAGGMELTPGLETMPAWLEDILTRQGCRNHEKESSRSSPPRRPTPRQQARWDAVQEAKHRGLSERAIATILGISRNTVSKYAYAISPPISPLWEFGAGVRDAAC